MDTEQVLQPIAVDSRIADPSRPAAVGGGEGAAACPTAGRTIPLARTLGAHSTSGERRSLAPVWGSCCALYLLPSQSPRGPASVSAGAAAGGRRYCAGERLLWAPRDRGVGDAGNARSRLWGWFCSASLRLPRAVRQNANRRSSRTDSLDVNPARQGDATSLREVAPVSVAGGVAGCDLISSLSRALPPVSGAPEEDR
jgi:hypothetical protein